MFGKINEDPFGVAALHSLSTMSVDGAGVSSISSK